MKSAYIAYSMSVIVSRALPDVRDGLKPVHRRVLYGMHQLGLTYNKSHKKSARIVGEVLGKYHPHGDTSVYDAMVRMAQDFSMSLVLLDGQPRPGVQVELFAMAADGSVTETMHTTDAQGVARVPAQSGVTYLADNVVVEALPNNDAKAGPVWKSDWAALTYFVP